MNLRLMMSKTACLPRGGASLVAIATALSTSTVFAQEAAPESEPASASFAPTEAAPTEPVSSGSDGQPEPAASEGGSDAGADGEARASLSLGGGAQTEASGNSSAQADQASETPVPSYAGARATRKPGSLSERYAQYPYLQRYKPEAGLWEVGIFTGMFFPSSSHNLKVAVLPFEEFSSVAGQLGGNLAYYPLSWLGAEFEGFGAGGSTKTDNYSSVFYALRLHAIAQLPLYSVTPFVLVGAGTLGAASETTGHDRDTAFHFGAGVKVPINHRLSGRFDFRDTMTQKVDADNGAQTHHPELHLGVSFVFDRTPPGPAKNDRDYDGLYDHEDKCPDQGALTVDGCPVDSDGDGILDPVDECPAVAGAEPTGCPNLDEDGDGVPVPADQCPNEMASTPNGCPDKDLDGDGIIGADDKCPKKPETRNGFQDGDGCPDEMPAEIKQFTGVIAGINFDQGTDHIKETSYETLDSAVGVLIKFKSIQIEVSGHTSSEGSAERNQELSVQRAEAVKAYFVGKGVEGKRVIARGAGSDEPVADNSTKEGREQNRRIEFRILSQR